MLFSFVKIITSVLCLDKFWKIYGTFLRIWSMFWKILSFISVVVCTIEFNLVLGAAWVNVLFWLNGYMTWYEFYRIDCSLYLLFAVIFSKFLVALVLSCWFISKPCLFAIGNNYHLLYEDSVVLLWSWSCCFMK